MKRHSILRAQWGSALMCRFFILVVVGLWGKAACALSVDVNQASIKELQTIKGIGAKTAQRIVAERSRGPFESLEHLSERLSGIGPKTIVKLRNNGLCVGTAQQPCENGTRTGQQTLDQTAVPEAKVVTPQVIRLP